MTNNRILPYLHLLLGAIILFSVPAFGHMQHVHQHIVREAYRLMSTQLGTDIPILKDHIGTSEIGDLAWHTGLVVAGAWREDTEDPVYGLGNGWPPGVSGTHFWQADKGDESDVTMYWWDATFKDHWTGPSAYKKMRRYSQPGAYGPWTIGYVYGGSRINGLPCGSPVILGAGFQFDDLINFFKTGEAYQVSFMAIDGTWYDCGGRYPVVLGETLRYQIAFEVLGRMCHLLGDMSVPAHAHGDAHNICDDPWVSGIGYDTYEMWVGSDGAPYNSPYVSWNGENSGAMVDPFVASNPLHFLMYTTQQIADHFSSNGPYDGDGNNNVPMNTGPYSFLPSYIASLGGPTSVEEFHCCWDPTDICINREGTTIENRNRIMNATLPYAIRATAGLLYWFAKESGLYPPPNLLLVPATYPTIASALSAATSGQTVAVDGAQTVSTSLTVNSGVTLRLNPGSSITFASSVSRLVVSGILNVDGLPFARVTFNGQGIDRSGYLYAPIVLASGGNCSIRHADFCNSTYGLTLYTNSGNSSVQNCTFSSFLSSSSTQALTVNSPSGTVLIDSNTVTGPGQGIGVYLISTNANVTVSNNSVSGWGTGIRPYSSQASLRGNSIRSNVNYGILGDNVSGNALYQDNDIRLNGYGVYLNSASPLIYRNTVIENSRNIYMSASSPNFQNPQGAGQGHNIIAYAASPLLSAQNSSDPVLGYDYSAGGNSLYETDLPHVLVRTNSIVYADRNYWGPDGPTGTVDGTSTFLSRNPLATDPNPSPLLKQSFARANLSNSWIPNSTASESDEVLRGIKKALDAGYALGSYSLAMDSLKWLANNRGTSPYAPLILLAYQRVERLRSLRGVFDSSSGDGSGFHEMLSNLAQKPAGHPLLPYALEFLSRDYTLHGEYSAALVNWGTLVENYPGTVHEKVALYNLLVYSVEIEHNEFKAASFLSVLKAKYPQDDLTISGRMLCGEAVGSNLPKEAEPTSPLPPEAEQMSAYPNPFNPSTTLTFDLPVDAQVRLIVYDVLGREISRPASGSFVAGHHQVVWDSRSLGQTIASGVYFARLDVKDVEGHALFTKTRKLLLTK